MNLQYRAAESFRENGLVFNSQGRLGGKNVQRDDVRPNPPAVIQRRCKWIIGDVTEVLDCNTWKLGKIAKMLDNDYFVIRLADCIQLKEFHISSLRIPLLHAPAEPFSAAKKGAERVKLPPAARNFPRSKALQRAGHHAYEDQRHGAKKSVAIGATNPSIGQTPTDALFRRSCSKKRKASGAESRQPRQRRTRPEQILNGASYRSSQLRGQEAECSVASCSVNDGGGQQRPAGRNAGSCFFLLPDDATSACPCTTSGTGREDGSGVPSEDGDDEEVEAAIVDVHELELEAYRSTVRALHASGPMTWEQESLLTNLRLSLNISNEEHLLQLRHLLSSSS